MRLKLNPKLFSWALTVGIALATLAVLAVQEGSVAKATATASAAKTVQIKNFAFKPATVEVNRGSRVSFANASGVPHTATSGSFDTKRSEPRKTASVKFNKRGTFAYHCKIHPFMEGKVIVE
jgi:plastocyanin